MLKVKPSDLKVAAKVSGGVKDVTAAGAKRHYWNSVHRLLLKDRKLTLMTNDGAIWMDWIIPIEVGGDGEFDTLVPAAQFNDMAARSAEGGLYEIRREDGVLHLIQGQRNLRIREETSQLYPIPEAGNGQQEFIVPAAPLARALKFVAPFIDATNPTPSKSIATLDTNGVLLGGSPKRVAQVSGLPRPPFYLSFKQKNARAVAGFLGQIEGNVRVMVDDRHYIFESVQSGHKILVLGESVQFPNLLRNLVGKETESWKVDNKTILSGVQILSALLPAEADRLNLRVRGLAADASLRLSTIGDDRRNSNDEFAIIRRFWKLEAGQLVERVFETDQIPSSWIAVNCRVFQEVLGQMEGTTMDVKFYSPQKLLYLEDEKGEEGDILKSLLLTIQPITEEEAVKEPELLEKPVVEKPLEKFDGAAVE